MTCNVGKRDRISRMLLGLLIIGMGVYYKNALGFLGLLFMPSALMGRCWAYSFLGFSTNKEKK